MSDSETLVNKLRKRPSPIAEGYGWPALKAKDGEALRKHYRATFQHLEEFLEHLRGEVRV